MIVAAKSLSKKIYMIIIISTMIILDLLFSGKTLVSYAVDSIQTNGPNTEYLNRRTNSEAEKEIREDKLLNQEIDSKLDVGVRTNNNATIKNIHNFSEIAYIDSLPIEQKAKENNISRAIIRKSISINTAIRYISNIFTIVAIIAVGSYFAEKRILKENIRF